MAEYVIKAGEEECIGSSWPRKRKKTLWGPKQKKLTTALVLGYAKVREGRPVP